MYNSIEELIGQDPALFRHCAEVALKNGNMHAFEQVYKFRCEYLTRTYNGKHVPSFLEMSRLMDDVFINNTKSDTVNIKEQLYAFVKFLTDQTYEICIKNKVQLSQIDINNWSHIMQTTIKFAAKELRWVELIERLWRGTYLLRQSNVPSSLKDARELHCHFKDNVSELFEWSIKEGIEHSPKFIAHQLRINPNHASVVGPLIPDVNKVADQLLRELPHTRKEHHNQYLNIIEQLNATPSQKEMLDCIHNIVRFNPSEPSTHITKTTTRLFKSLTEPNKTQAIKSTEMLLRPNKSNHIILAFLPMNKLKNQ